MEGEFRSLVKLLESQVQEAHTASFDVSTQRSRNHRMYSMEPLGNEVKGRSKYVSPDVQDAVESKKAIFAETFLSDRDAVRFAGSRVPFEDDAKTAYVNAVFRKNNYERLFRDAFHDAFVAKRCVVLVDWVASTKTETVDIQGADPNQYQAILAQHNPISVAEENIVTDPSGLLTGIVEIEKDDSHAELHLVEPERYYRDPNASYPCEAMFVAMEQDVTRARMLMDGYDPEQIDGLQPDYRFRNQDEDSSRKAFDGTYQRLKHKNRTGVHEIVTVYRTWTWLDQGAIADDPHAMAEEVRLYEVHWSCGEVLRWADGTPAIREVEDIPFFEWTEMKVSHSAEGTCTADVMSETQRTQSILKRLIIDNQQMRNTTRYEATVGALKNPRDLLDNTIGGVIWSRQPGSVTPLATPELSPLTMNVVQLLKSDGDERNGMSGLAKGMNDGAVNNQNASDMIDKLTTSGRRRVTMAARDFARTFLVPISQHIVKLAMQNDQTQDAIEVGGQMIPVVPSQWADDDLEMEVAAALTPDEAQRQASQLTMMHSTMMQDPSMADIYGVMQKHALFDKIFDLVGIKNTSQYMISPQSPEFAQMAKQKEAQAMEQLRQSTEQLELQKQLTAAQITGIQQTAQSALMKAQTDLTDRMFDNNMDVQKFEHEQMVDIEKLNIDRKKVVGQ
jgi:hypothetical protein